MPPPSSPTDTHRRVGPGADARKLTVYVGERTRGDDGGFLTEKLLEIFAAHRVATSILLRGIEGFGIAHHLRSDRSLSLSEDPPVVAVAVDTTDRIDAVLADVEALHLRGLVTVERARLLRDVMRPADAPAGPPTGASGARKLTVYLGRGERSGHVRAYQAVCGLMHREGLSGAAVLAGVDGTIAGTRQQARFFASNGDVPAMVIAIGETDRIARVLSTLPTLVHDPLVTLEQVDVCKRDGVLIAAPPRPPTADADGLALWQKIMVYSSESTLHHGAPVHRALVRGLRSSGVARGATTLRGVWGFHGDHAPHGDRFLQVRRRVPVATIAVDEPAHIARSFAVIDEMTAEHGLVTSEIVPALLSAQPEGRHGGLHLAHHDRQH